MLWRIKDCEELLKSRVSIQELKDQVTGVETRVRYKSEQEYMQLNERMEKIKCHLELRIKSAENLQSDRFDDIRITIKAVEDMAQGMASTE